MDEGKLTELLHVDEGVVDEIYLDHLGFKTFGAGHLVKESDPEFTQPVGTKVSRERINECFREDLRTTLFDCERLYPHFYELPENAQMVIASMAFNRLLLSMYCKNASSKPGQVGSFKGL